MPYEIAKVEQFPLNKLWSPYLSRFERYARGSNPFPNWSYGLTYLRLLHWFSIWTISTLALDRFFFPLMKGAIYIYIYIYIYICHVCSPSSDRLIRNFFSNQNFNSIIYDTIIAANANHSYSNFTGTNFKKNLTDLTWHIVEHGNWK